MVKNPPANAGDLRDAGLIPGWEDPLEKEMTITPVFLPGEAHGGEEPMEDSGLVGCSPWGHKESYTTVQLSRSLHAEYALTSHELPVDRKLLGHKTIFQRDIGADSGHQAQAGKCSHTAKV